MYVAQRIDVPEHQVALKILPRSLYVGRNVERELVMLATVGHPHVVQLKDHGTTDEYVWLTMPVHEGETLHERLQHGTPAARGVRDLPAHRVRAGGAARRGARHQDIKPENIYLAVFGRRIHPVLLDLGVAAEKDATFVAGTALYGAPEQVFALDASPHKPPLTEKMDTYSLATTLLVSLVGPKYFPGETAQQPAELAGAHAVRATDPIAPEALPELKGRALDEADRSAEEVARARAEGAALDERGGRAARRAAGEGARGEAVRGAREGAAEGGAPSLPDRGRGSGARGAGRRRLRLQQAETLRLADELEHAQKEGAASFDKLDTCVASHKVAKSEAAACKAQRDEEQADFQRGRSRRCRRRAPATTGCATCSRWWHVLGQAASSARTAATAAQQKCTEDTHG